MEESKTKTIFQVVLFAILGGAILYFMWQSQGAAYAEDCSMRGIEEIDCSLLNKLVDDFKGANLFWLLVVSICFTLSQLFRAIRWRILLRPVGYEVTLFNSFATLMVGYFANLGIPRIGEFVRAGFISKYEEVPVEKAFATIVIERVVDVIMLLIMLLIGLAFHYDALWGYITDHMSITTSQLVIYGGILIAIGLVGLWVLGKILKMDESNLHPIGVKIKSLISGFVEGLLSIKKLPNVTGFILYSIGIWMMYFLMHYLAFFAYEPVSHLSAAQAVLVFDFGTLGIVFPSPGGMGSYHFMIVEALKIFGINPVEGFSFAMITFFTLTIFCTIIIGLISLILLPIVNKRPVNG